MPKKCWCPQILIEYPLWTPTFSASMPYLFGRYADAIVLAVLQFQAIELSEAMDGLRTRVQLSTVPSTAVTVPVMTPVILITMPPNRVRASRETPKLV
jgi:hypothetical protein